MDKAERAGYNKKSVAAPAQRAAFLADGRKKCNISGLFCVLQKGGACGRRTAGETGAKKILKRFESDPKIQKRDCE